MSANTDDLERFCCCQEEFETSVIADDGIGLARMTSVVINDDDCGLLSLCKKKSRGHGGPSKVLSRSCECC